MAGGYQVGIASETKAFKQGIESGVIEPLEDAQKELLELGKSRGPEQLERAMKDAQKETKDLKSETERTARAIEQEYRDSYRKMKRDSDDAFDKASEGAEEFKDEAQQSIKETAASFSDVTDAVDLVQEVAANAFSGFGPAGVAAGAAAAIGIGAAVSGFEAVSEAEQASRERASEWAQAFVDAGSTIVSSTISVAKQTEIATDPEKYKTATENAKNWGVDVSVAIAAMAGETWALNAANDALTKSEKDAAAEAVKLADGGEALADMLVGQTAQTRAGRDAMNQLQNEMEGGKAQFDALSDSLLKTIENAGEATLEVDKFGNKLVTLPEGEQIVISAETGQATTNLDLFKDDLDGVPETVRTDVIVKAALRDAQNAVNGFVRANDGKSFTLRGRVKVDSGFGLD